MLERPRRYRAFISYSQKDKAHARRLHRALESYRLPRGIESDRIDTKTRKLGRFFRDDEEMGAATDLGAALQGAIADADGLIVVCSPHAAQSRWVNEEIIHFKRTGRADDIFALIVGGEPNATPERRDRECFPPALRFAVGPSGVLADQPAEPLGLDMRGEPFNRLIARLVAGLIRTPFDALWMRERRRRRARLAFTIVSAFFALCVIGSGAGMFLVSLARSASIAQSHALSLAARDSLDAGWHSRALRLAVLAARRGTITSVAPEARLALATAVAGSRHSIEFSAHDGPVFGIAYSPDGRRIASAGRDGAVRLWDAETHRKIGEDLRHSSWVYAVTFSPDGTEIATASDEGVKIWSASSHALLKTISLHPGPMSVAYSSNGRRILSDNTLIDAGTRQVIGRVGGRLLRFAEGGTTIIGGRQDASNRIEIWDGMTGRALHQPPVEPGSAARAIVADARNVAVATEDGDVFVWNAVTWQRAAPPLPHRDSLLSETASQFHIQFAPDRDVLATVVTSIVSQATVLRLWDLSTGQPIGAPFRTDSSVASMAMSPDGAQLALALFTGAIELVQVRAPSIDGAQAKGPGSRVETVGFTRDGRFLLTSAEGAEEILVLDGQTGAPARAPVAGQGFSIATHGNVLIAREEHEVTVWDTSNGLSFLTAIPVSAVAASVTADGSRIALATRSELELMELATMRVLARTPIDFNVLEIAFSPDARLLSAAGFDAQGDRSILVNATTLQRAPIDTQSHPLIFAPDADHILMAGGGAPPRVVSIRAGFRQQHAFDPDSSASRGLSGSTAASFSSDSALLVAVGREAWPSVWNVASGAVAARLPSGDLMTSQVAFSRDHARVIVSSAPLLAAGGTTRIWDLATQSLVAPPIHHPWAPHALALSPDGARLAVGGEDGYVGMWDISFAGLTSENLVDRTCTRELENNDQPNGASRINEADARAVPAVRPMIGLDVCRRRTVLEELRDAMRLVISGVSSATR